MHSCPIVFFNTTTHEQDLLIPAGATPAIVTLYYWLVKEGISGTAMFPESLDIDMSNLRERFEEYIAGNSVDIYAISCWSSSYTIALMYIEIIKEKDLKLLSAAAHIFTAVRIFPKPLITEDLTLFFKGAQGLF